MPPARQTHCGRGHPLEGRNAIEHEFGGRECRKCKNLRAVAAYAKRKERSGRAMAENRETRSPAAKSVHEGDDLRNSITYAKTGGPPDNWHQLQVRDLDTGQLVDEVVEVNTDEGWIERYKQRENGQPVLDPITLSLVVERVHGRFAIEVRP